MGLRELISDYAMSEGQVKECKRDIEGEIKRARERLAIESTFKDALMEYVHFSQYPTMRKETFSLNELVGSLVVGIQRLEREVDSLIKLQEKEK